MQHYRQPIEKEILDEKNPFHKRSFQWRSFFDLEPLSVAMVTKRMVPEGANFSRAVSKELTPIIKGWCNVNKTVKL